MVKTQGRGTRFARYREGSEAETTDAEASEEIDEPAHLARESNRIASEAVTNADSRLPDFDMFCVTIELIQDTLLWEVP